MEKLAISKSRDQEFNQMEELFVLLVMEMLCVREVL